MVERCPECGRPFHIFGPFRRLECTSEHVFVEQPDGTLQAVKYPEWSAQQIRDAEVELYQEQRVDRLPDRRAALDLLRERHDQQEAWRA